MSWNLLGGLFEKLAKFAKEKIWIVMFIWICTVFIKFAPDGLLKQLDLLDLSQEFDITIGMAVVFSTGLIFIRLIKFLQGKYFLYCLKRQKVELLRRFEQLQEEINNKDLTVEDCLKWASKVAPHLKFNDKIHNDFLNSRTGLITFRGERKYFDNVLDKMKHLLDMAINYLDNEIQRGTK